ncbi:hypothetical protein ACLKMY_32875 [Paraburkholderia mimosarum]|uniref:hypothetical protein n=1 Tax=Paraburkholderia mimosarum TaxID=312026 RepID=UPI0039C4CF60
MTEKTPPKPKRGRPAVPDTERLVVRSIRLTAAQWSALDAHGMAWLREFLEAEPTGQYVARAVRLTPAQAALLDANGMEWLRVLIDRAQTGPRLKHWPPPGA